MENKIQVELVCAIVNCGLGSKVIKIAKQNQITGGTVMIGRGIGCNGFLNFFGLSEVRKEIVFMIALGESVSRTMEDLKEELELYKKNHGVAFTMPLHGVVGAHNISYRKEEQERRETDMYQAITIVVDKGKAEDVIAAAVKAGAKGGTIINGRGSGVHETEKLFNLEIEPEKEIIFILAKKESVDAIIDSVRNDFHIDEPGKGIIYTQDIGQVYGIIE